MAKSTNTLEIYGVFIAAALVMKNRRKRRNRAIWTRQWILDRPKYSAYHQLINELRSFDQSSYKNFLRMDASTFENLFTNDQKERYQHERSNISIILISLL